jgi:hypothetical protein
LTIYIDVKAMESKAELEGVISRDIHHDFIAAERAESSEKADSSLHSASGEKGNHGYHRIGKAV